VSSASQAGRDGSEDEEGSHDLSGAITIDSRTSNQTNAEGGDQSYYAGVGHLFFGQAEVGFDCLWDERREGKPGEERNKETEPAKMECPGVGISQPEERNGITFAVDGIDDGRLPEVGPFERGRTWNWG